MEKPCDVWISMNFETDKMENNDKKIQWEEVNSGFFSQEKEKERKEDRKEAVRLVNGWVKGEESTIHSTKNTSRRENSVFLSRTDYWEGCGSSLDISAEDYLDNIFWAFSSPNSPRKRIHHFPRNRGVQFVYLNFPPLPTPAFGDRGTRSDWYISVPAVDVIGQRESCGDSSYLTSVSPNIPAHARRKTKHPGGSISWEAAENHGRLHPPSLTLRIITIFLPFPITFYFMYFFLLLLSFFEIV